MFRLVGDALRSPHDALNVLTQTACLVDVIQHYVKRTVNTTHGVLVLMRAFVLLPFR